MKPIISSILYLALGLFLTGCANLKAVNDYAKSSKEIINAYNQTNISLTESYKHIALFECAIKNLNKPGFAPTEKKCYDKDQLTTFQKSDSLVSIVNTTLAKYFLALEELSKNNSSSFELKNETLKQILSDDKTFNISSDKLDASSSLVQTLTNDLAFGVYKRKQLGKIIKAVHNDLSKVIEMNQGILDDIKRNIKNNIETTGNKYKKVYNRTKSISAKFKATQDYFEENKQWTAKIGIIDKYSVALDEIIKGHGELLKKGKKLKTKDVITSIAGYTTKVIEIRNEIKKLKDHE